MTTKRFTKEKLLLDLVRMRDSRGLQHGFIAGNGWAQVKGKGEELNREYGEWDFIRDLISMIDSGDIGR